MTNRREFLKTVAGASAGLFFAPYLSAKPKKNEQAEYVKELKKNPLRLAVVGCGLMGGADMHRLRVVGQKFVAYCDVDTGKYGFGNAKKYAEKDAKGFVDYREMFDKMKGKIDGVVIATPDHAHFAPAMLALKYGFPVFLEKPMCRNIWQIRELTKFAAQKGLPTQMGNMVRSGDGIRITKEWIAAGLIGKVREVVMWTTRPLGGCNRPTMAYKEWPSEPIPAHLDWDKWLNVAEYGPYSSEIVPLNWRRVYKYGTGSLGDIGTHILDVPMYALDLGYPSKVEARQTGGTEISVPRQDHVTYYFDKSNQGEKVKLSWYSGFLKPNADGKWQKGYDESFLPPLPKAFTETGRSYKDLSTADGMFIIGDEGVLYSPKMHLMGKPIVLPKSRAKDAAQIEQSIERIKFANHYLNFVEAVQGKVKKAASDFSDVAKLTEVVMLGNLALRSGENIHWDAANMSAIGASKKVASFVNEPMRSGWY